MKYPYCMMCLDTVAEFLKKNSLKIIAYKLLKMWFIKISEWLLLFFEWVYAKKKNENILHVSLNVVLVKLIPFAFPFKKFYEYVYYCKLQFGWI